MRTSTMHSIYRLFTWICFYLCSIGAFVPSQNRPSSTHHFALTIPDNLLPSADILKLIANTDRGADASRTLQDAVNLWIFNKADHYANHSTTIALNDPNLFGNYDVAFVGTSRAQAQEGNPAGGRFRGKLGRMLYQTTGVYQNILKEEDMYRQQSTSSSPGRTLAVNYIRGKLFSRFPLSVILRGVVTPITVQERAALTSKYGTRLSPSTVRADFEPPLLTLGRYGFRIGPSSSVVLDTPYVDDQVRLGVGSRGSTFVFRRTTDPEANGWMAEMTRRPFKARNLGLFMMFMGGVMGTVLPSKLIHMATAVTVTAGGYRHYRTLAGVCRWASVPMAVVGFMLSVTKGGIIEPNSDT